MKLAFPSVLLIVAALSPALQGDDKHPPLPKLATKVAFPNLTFDRPVAMAYPGRRQQPPLRRRAAPGEDLVVPQPARQPHQAALPPAQVAHQSRQRGGPARAGLPPQVQGEPAVLRLLLGQRQRRRGVRSSRGSRSRAPTIRVADPASEQRIWVSAKDPFENHNGGTIAFGRTAISTSPWATAVPPMIRSRPARIPATGSARSCGSTSIIPTTGKPYGIPKRQSQRARPEKFAHWAPEVYCIGLRNVWKFSFDRKTGDLWAGDVGQNLWEMVHRIENGGNYGWSIREGFHPFQPERRQRPDPRRPDPAADRRIPPRAHADRPDSGLSITGGYVYRGKKIPELVGRLCLRRLRDRPDLGPAVRGRQGRHQRRADRRDKHPKLNIASFGEDAEGELYILAFDGRIHELVPRGR